MLRARALKPTWGAWRVVAGALLLAGAVGCNGQSPSPTSTTADSPQQNPAAELPQGPADMNIGPMNFISNGPWDSDPPHAVATIREGARSSKPAPLGPRPWKAAILTCSPEEVTAANYLKAKSAVAYPNVSITIVPVSFTPDTTTASGQVGVTYFINTVAAALNPLEAAMGRRFDMIQLLHQFPHHVNWSPISPMCMAVAPPPVWSPESILMVGDDAMTLADYPLSMNPYPSQPFQPWIGPWTGNANWRMTYMVTRLEGRSLAEVEAKIDLACATPGTTKAGVIVDGPGKAGAANNYSGGTCNIDTYWQHAWEFDDLYNMQYVASKYGFPLKNDVAGYAGDLNHNCNDDANEMPATAYQYQTSSSFPVAYLVSFGKHSNADGRFGPAFTTPMLTYGHLPFAPRAVVCGGESFTGYSLGPNAYGGTNLGDWLDLPVAAVIAWKNEPCQTGSWYDAFAEGYVGRNATLGEAAMSSFQWLKSVDTAFGVCWMTLK